MTTMNISDYAKHADVNRKTITRWIKAGKYIVMAGDEIDVEASDQNLKKYWDSKDPRTKNAAKNLMLRRKNQRKKKAVFSSAPNRCMPVWFPVM